MDRDLYFSTEQGLWHVLRGAIVTPDDAQYLAWRASHEPPTTTIAEVRRIMQAMGMGHMSPAETMAELKASAKAQVSAAAEAQRARYITPGSGKAMAYQEVAAEAVRYIAAAGEGAYPFLQARVDSGRYPTLAAAAQGTVAIDDQWVAIGSAIDRCEDAAKIAIDAASTAEQVAAAATVVWP